METKQKFSFMFALGEAVGMTIFLIAGVIVGIPFAWGEFFHKLFKHFSNSYHGHH